jgi:copper chaperone
LTVRAYSPSCPSTVLTSFAGVKSFDVSLDSQTASVVTEPTLDYNTVLEKIKKTGKKVNSGEADGQPQAV